MMRKHTNSLINNPVAHRAIDNFETLVAPELKAKYKNAITTKNPLALSTFEERGASIGAKLERIRNSNAYKKMSPEQQEHVRANIYDRVVAPSYYQSGMGLPDKKMWVEMASKNHSVLGSDDLNSQFARKDTQAVTSAILGFDKGLTGIEIFGLKVANKTFQAMHEVDRLFSAHMPQVLQRTEDGSLTKTIQRQIAVEQHHVESTDFWLNTHYRDSVINSLAYWTGEQVAAAPIYKAVNGAIQAGIATRAGLSLSKTLVATKAGRLVFESLKGATDGFVGSLVTSGGNTNEAKANAAGGAILGPVANKVGQKLASNALIKKWTAKLLLNGGKPFAEDLAASANHEETAIIHHLTDGAEHKAGNTIEFGQGISLTHKDANSGHINFQGVDHPYNTPEERNVLMGKVLKLHDQIRSSADPLMGELHKAEKLAQNSLSQSLYGKPLSRLNKEQASRVLIKRQALIDQAAFEAPAHLQEEVKEEAQITLSKEYETNPSLKADAEAIEKKYGVTIAGTVAAKNVENVAIETGIKDKGITAAKILKPAEKKVKIKSPVEVQEKEYEPPDGASAFMNYRKNNIVYFKNSKNIRELLKDDRLGMNEATYRARKAADGTKVGARDNRGWDQIVTEERRKRFIDQLTKVDGGAIKFESPMHQMLFHFAERNSFSAPLKAKFLREMKSMPGYEDWTTKDFDKAADWTMLHIYELAKSGRLASEGNMFASTKVQGGPGEKWTTWQFNLANENDLEQVKIINNSLQRHPQVRKQIMNMLKGITQLKYKAKTVDEYIQFDKQIAELSQAASIQAGTN